MQDSDQVTEEIAREALEMLDVDPIGLEPTDREILESIITKFGGGPVGVTTIAAATSEEAQTIEDVYEPYLMRLGFVRRTPAGRVVEPRAFEHLGKKPPRKLL